MLQELIKAFFFIFIAEMGDKTQILAMTFATKYKVSKVLLGVFLGCALNHGIAILIGVYLAREIPINTVQLIAAIAFIIFGLWTLRSEGESEETESQSSFGPVLTVALAFFIGELGDKTQLTAITLAVNARFPWIILVGTVSGMMATSGIGIFIGSRFGKKIPEYAIKFVSAFVFIVNGVIQLFETVPASYKNGINILIFFIVLLAAIMILILPDIKNTRNKKITPLKEAAAELYMSTHKINTCVNEICLGEDYCGSCQGKGCPIGFAKEALQEYEKSGEYITSDMEAVPDYKKKGFDLNKVREGIILSAAGCMNCGKSHNKGCVLNKSREALELIYFGGKLPFKGDIHKYIREVEKRDRKLAEEIRIRIKEKTTNQQ